jgi:hypothetical protein
MKYDIYIPQTPNVFEEDDLSEGIWLQSCDCMDPDTVEELVEARMRATANQGDDGFVDIVIRVYRG